MAEVHHFTYGAFNPIAAFLVAMLGSFLGLLSTGRARSARTRGRRSRWLIIAAFSIGGAAIWLMHFTAMLGFEVPQSPVRYSPGLTMISLGLAVLAVGFGLMVVGHGRRSLPRVVLAGVLTGAGVLAMHYTGMAGMHVSGTIHYDLPMVIASGIIAVVASTTALWFTVSVKGWAPMLGAAAIMAVAVCGMHYTGMAAMGVKLADTVSGQTTGIRPLLMIVPITLISAATILGVALSALQAMTEEEFTDGAGIPRRGVHAENHHPWSLKQASLSAARRTPGSRPSPRPVAPRQPVKEEPLIDIPS
ncbi:MHYT domain-containing protein [Couchioplanes caeruleus]|uniref:Histidine kinase n=2 Tax=Couchioplanes caeruleus TaxID=56438 RepID=A0A1K0G432_9ACTN|nr:MHYT domain-containing protein [Couchioplanes caeruleus]OJF12050.1 histidine kinase [Couchioplanes caeruleus subsp. caeruleus]ROP29742.1 NO-binding membrane sensor protein with MHYT domain [Couchioplanes caeruleus]